MEPVIVQDKKKSIFLTTGMRVRFIRKKEIRLTDDFNI